MCFCLISTSPTIIIFLRRESLIFDAVLMFSSEVAEDDTISIIQNAIAGGKLGELSVNVSYIIGIPPVEQTTTAAPTSTTSKSDGSLQILVDSGSINLSACYS